MKALTEPRESDRITVSSNGWVRCPNCGEPNLKRIYPDERCERLQLYCRRCKQAVYVTIQDGRCFHSRCL